MKPNVSILWWVLAILLSLLPGSLPAVAQEEEEEDENAVCFRCHDDEELTAERDGEEILAHVDPKAYAGSVHGTQECINCHADLEDASLPHEDDLERVECGDCHDDQAEMHAASLHGQALAEGDKMAPSCADCHGKHDILSNKDPAAPTAFMGIPFLCGKCHKEGSDVSRTHEIDQKGMFENYSQSIHGEGVFKKGLVVTAVCTSCHTSHDIRKHEDPKASIHRDLVSKTCMQCHARIEYVHEKVIEGRLWEEEPHKIPVCIDCHAPHEIRLEEPERYERDRFPQGMRTSDCLTCHARTDITMERDGETISLHVNPVAYGISIHGQKPVACAGCHSQVSAGDERACATITTKVDCGACHAEQVGAYTASAHGALQAVGDPDAPGCLDCHEKHTTKSKRIPTSPTFKRNVPELCGRCHRQGEKAAIRLDDETVNPVGSYEMSIHGRGLLKGGLLVTATCTDCHPAHGVRPPADPQSSVHPENVAATCGKCHHGVEEVFRTSIHWPGNNPGAVGRLPTCESCHTSHEIGRTTEEGFRLTMMRQCGNCHREEAETFFDTYHGKVSRLGSERAAKCYDCHGTHNVLPPMNPDSTLSRDNVVATCGQCHTGSHRQFAGYLTHATHHDPEKYPWLFWTFWGMTTLLVGTLAFALLHTLAWLIRLWMTRDEWKAHKAASATADRRLFRRFNRYQRSLHIVLILSFFTLALTGMSLKFSYMAWAKVLGNVLGGFDTMGILHRMGAVTLFIVFFLHLWDVRKLKRQTKRTWWQLITGPDSILFHPRDIRQAGQAIRWFFGRGPRPKFGRYTYWEKFDYLAVFWGVAVIGLTGLILWFPEIFTHIVPGWFVNVATIIHSDEALLAVGFIFTIHFFNTHFRPDKWPMDTVIFTGRVTVDELKYDKPAEYERLVESGELESRIYPPLADPVVRGFKIFGFIALVIGLTLIAAIVYSVLYGYR